MLDDVRRVRANAEDEIRDARDLGAVAALRTKYLGRRGLVSDLTRRVSTLPPEQRPEAGAEINELRAAVTRWLEEAASTLQALGALAGPGEALDVTLPGRLRHVGRQHILTETLDRIVEIFVGMGFEVVEGTEVETDEFNFGRLNFGAEHPARDAQDSFYLSDEVLLRTHTTVVDARVMVGRTPPMRVLTTGRNYRRDPADATHMPVFHQIDGFMVGERVTFAELRGVLAQYVRELFGADTTMRFQPSYFPFTEPSAELAVWFRGRWLELLGCGMFHPNVLRFAGIDPERYTAFAFGMGVDRPTMIRYDIPDIRLLWENDMRFLRQF